jgi:RNA polymerase sigma-70 factor (ECF subfamily)
VADDETRLIERAKKDANAFGELYEKYVAQIYSYIYYRTGNHHDAEDLTSKTFFRALSHMGRYHDRGVPFGAWLYRIAHNLVANWHRDRGRRRIQGLNESLVLGETGSAPERWAQAREDKRALLRVVDCLDPRRQELLILKFVEGLSNAKIGEIMGCTEGAVKSLYYRTLMELREKLRQQESIAENIEG